MLTALCLLGLLSIGFGAGYIFPKPAYCSNVDQLIEEVKYLPIVKMYFKEDKWPRVMLELEGDILLVASNSKSNHAWINYNGIDIGRPAGRHDKEISLTRFQRKQLGQIMKERVIEHILNASTMKLLDR